jgi:hypothetical protein
MNEGIVAKAVPFNVIDVNSGQRANTSTDLYLFISLTFENE